MNGADIAASMIREGQCPQAAVAAAARRTGERYKAIAAELGRRNARNRREAVAARERAAIRRIEAEEEKYAAMFQAAMCDDKQLALKGVEG